MKELYLFSGLGADERAFQKMNFPGYKTTFIKWEKPGSHTIEEYAKSLLTQIHAKNPILIGLSFGGIMAIEVAKQIPTEKVILIASAQTYREIPFYYKIARILPIYKLPSKLLKQVNPLTYWLFGAQSAEDKKLLQEIIKDTDMPFFKWAVEKIVKWRSTIILPNTVHIHGTKDRILPYRFVKTDITVYEGGHFMTVNRAKEITMLVKNLLG